MRFLLCACLFAVACKSESKPPAAQAEQPTPTEVAPETRRRQRPALPDTDTPPTTAEPDTRAKPRLPEEQPRDWNDPEFREQMRERREERRARREKMLDTNKDGVISDEERRARLGMMVQRFDADGDGKLTPDELSNSNRRMGFDDPAALDTDKNGEISVAELETAIKARREQMRAQWRGRRGGGDPGAGSDVPE